MFRQTWPQLSGRYGGCQPTGLARAGSRCCRATPRLRRRALLSLTGEIGSRLVLPAAHWRPPDSPTSYPPQVRWALYQRVTAGFPPAQHYAELRAAVSAAESAAAALLQLAPRELRARLDAAVRGEPLPALASGVSPSAGGRGGGIGAVGPAAWPAPAPAAQGGLGWGSLAGLPAEGSSPAAPAAVGGWGSAVGRGYNQPGVAPGGAGGVVFGSLAGQPLPAQPAAHGFGLLPSVPFGAPSQAMPPFGNPPAGPFGTSGFGPPAASFPSSHPAAGPAGGHSPASASLGAGGLLAAMGVVAPTAPPVAKTAGAAASMTDEESWRAELFAFGKVRDAREPSRPFFSSIQCQLQHLNFCVNDPRLFLGFFCRSQRQRRLPSSAINLSRGRLALETRSTRPRPNLGASALFEELVNNNK